MVTSASAQPMSTKERLAQIRKTLSEHRPVDALGLARQGRDGSNEMENAAAVCMMRNGAAQEAHRIYRALLFPGGTMVMDSSAPAQYKANYVYSLMKSGRIPEALETLSKLADSTDPAVVRLRDAVKRWRKSLPWPTRILVSLRLTCPKKIKLDIPAGEV